MTSIKKEGIATSVPHNNSRGVSSRITSHANEHLQSVCAEDHKPSQAFGENNEAEIISHTSETPRTAQLELFKLVKKMVEQHFKKDFQLHNGQVYLVFLEGKNEITSPYFTPRMDLVWFPEWEKGSNSEVFYSGRGMRLCSIDFLDEILVHHQDYIINKEALDLVDRVQHHVSSIWMTIYNIISEWCEYTAKPNEHISECLKIVAECIADTPTTCFDFGFIPRNFSEDHDDDTVI